ncbi:MAG: hypothetical protein KY451_14060 [Actinobacteria bacterium]|nr:hypothetical protein [Actinomycetota bacterium]
MRTSKNKGLLIPAFAAAVVMLSPTAAYAGPDDQGQVTEEGVVTEQQHGETEGHLPAKQENVELVGRADIVGAEEGRVADVAAFGNFAYLTVRDPEGCSDAGVAIMDISNPAAPRQVGFIEATEGSFPGEGAQVLDVKTKSFRGQILLFNNELCRTADGTVGQGGMTMWDVTNPAAPVLLAANVGDATADGEANLALNSTHSVLGWTDGPKAYAVLVDNDETADVDIMDISDPRNPVLISETDLNDFDVLQEENTPLGGNSFLHDVEVQKIKGVMTMVASYWDGGWTLLNVNDPANPVYLRDFDYSAKDTLTGLSRSEGNAHQAEFSPDGRSIVGTDEDFSPFRLTFTSAAGDAEAAQGSNTPQLDAGTSLSGTPVFLGPACQGPLPAATGGATIAVVERGGCTFTTKAGNVDAAGGYTGVVLVNNACTGIVTPFVKGALPFVSVDRTTGFAIFGDAFDVATCEAGTPGTFTLGDTGAPVSAAAVFDGWGYTRLVDTATMTEIGAYAIDEALDPDFASGFGDLSVHEVAVDPKKKGLAYLSYYSGGLRVIEYGPNGIQEVGAFIAEGGNNFWGVEYHLLPQGNGQGKAKAGPAKNELILASDRDSGLWIFRYTGGK